MYEHCTAWLLNTPWSLSIGSDCSHGHFLQGNMSVCKKVVLWWWYPSQKLGHPHSSALRWIRDIFGPVYLLMMCGLANICFYLHPPYLSLWSDRRTSFKEQTIFWVTDCQVLFRLLDCSQVGSWTWRSCRYRHNHTTTEGYWGLKNNFSRGLLLLPQRYLSEIMSSPGF